MPTFGDIIVIAVLLVAVGFSVRSLWKKKKQGGGCTGNCASCGGCCGCHSPSDSGHCCH